MELSQRSHCCCITIRHPEIVESNFGNYHPHGIVCVCVFVHELHKIIVIVVFLLFVLVLLFFYKCTFELHNKKSHFVKNREFITKLSILYAKLNINIYSVKILCMQTMHITHTHVRTHSKRVCVCVAEELVNL